jgi:hypothetical protein
MSKSTLSFQLSNLDPRAKGKAMLYKTEDPNTLVLTIKNTGPAIPLKAGAPVDENKPDPAGASSLFLAFADLLEQGATGLREVKLSLPGWKAIYSSGDSASWALTPEQDGTFASKAELEITLEGIQVDPDITMGVFSVDYFNFPKGGEDNWQANVQVAEPPSKGKGDLTKILSPYWLNSTDSIFVTPTGEAALSNELNLTLFYSGSKAIKATNNTKISLYFIYDNDPGYGALCTKEEANNIDLRTVATYGNGWLGGKNGISKLPTWDYMVRGTMFGAGDNSEVDFKLSQIKSSLQPGSTQMFITWNCVPDFNDGQVGILIRKNMPPVIKTFTATPAKITVVDQNAMVPVTVNWEVQNCDSVSIDSETGFAPKGETTVLVGYGKQEILLTAVFGGGNSKPVKRRLKVPVAIANKPEPVFEKFSVSPSALHYSDKIDYEVQVEWAVRNASEIFFEGGWLTDVKAFNGSRVLSIPFSKFHQLLDRPDFWAVDFTLNAVNTSNTKTEKKSIQLLLSRRRLYEDKLKEIVKAIELFHGSSYSAIDRGSVSYFISGQLQGALIPLIKDISLEEVSVIPQLQAGLQSFVDTKGTIGNIPDITLAQVNARFVQLMSNIQAYLDFDWRNITQQYDNFMNQYGLSEPNYLPSPVNAKGELAPSVGFDDYLKNALAIALSFKNPIKLKFNTSEFSRELSGFLSNPSAYKTEYQLREVSGMIEKLEALTSFIEEMYPKARNA